jgi:hypothetical protein
MSPTHHSSILFIREFEGLKTKEEAEKRKRKRKMKKMKEGADFRQI